MYRLKEVCEPGMAERSFVARCVTYSTCVIHKSMSLKVIHTSMRLKGIHKSMSLKNEPYSTVVWDQGFGCMHYQSDLDVGVDGQDQPPVEDA